MQIPSLTTERCRDFSSPFYSPDRMVVKASPLLPTSAKANAPSQTSLSLVPLTNRSLQPTCRREGVVHPSPINDLPAKRILLVDDDSTVRNSLNNVLVDEGYVVTLAENGQRAVDLANDIPVDLVLLDLTMPVKNGWDTFEELTREHPTIPVIIATARPNQLFTAVSAGAGALLEKPMDIPILLQTIQGLLNETAERRLARLAGKNREFHYKPAPAFPNTSSRTVTL